LPGGGPDRIADDDAAAVQAVTSSEAFFAPVIPSMRNRGSRSISEPGSGVRSRIVSRMSKSASLDAASSSPANASEKNATSARSPSFDQSAQPCAARCQSSNTASLVTAAVSPYQPVSVIASAAFHGCHETCRLSVDNAPCVVIA
jgi:hypothetical protein